MSEAVIVNNASKHFGKAGQPLWKRLAPAGQVTPALNDAALIPAGASVAAVNRISFSIREGEIFGIVGPKGSGKSTLIRLIATLLLPDAGSISVFGHDVVQQSIQAQRLINRVSEESSFFRKLSAMENLVYGARLYGMAGGETRAQIVEILVRMGMDESAIYRPMEGMERSLQQKVAIARALIAKPRLLLLDEPTAGLDSHSRHAVHELVCELNSQYGTTVLLTTRDMDEANILCERIAILAEGSIAALNAPAFIRPAQRSGSETNLENAFREGIFA